MTADLPPDVHAVYVRECAAVGVDRDGRVCWAWGLPEGVLRVDVTAGYVAIWALPIEEPKP